MAAIKDRSIGDRAFVCVNTTLLLLLTMVFLYPMWHCLMASFSDPGRLLSHMGVLIKPLGYSLAGYKAVLSNRNILVGYQNTLFYVGVGTLTNMVLTILGAYALSRKRLMLRRPLTLLIVLTMYLDAGLIPSFLLVRGLGLYNSRWAIILVLGVTTYNLIVMRTAFTQVARSLEESAMIDGAGDLTILFRIILPVTKATLAVVVLFYAVTHWNMWFTASIYLRDRSKYPLQLFLREILLANATQSAGDGSSAVDGAYYLEELIKYCTIIVSTVPVLCIYPFVQKYFVSGVMLGSLKE